MAQYKVPQDVEADDKLLGPFSFRQFVYLLIAGGLVALAVALFQLFPLLAIIPVPFILFLAILALPLKKDQPMEAYVAAIVSYYLKPRTKRWTPGQRESTVLVTAPKQTDDEPARKRNISGDEVTHRLSFLADIVDTEGYAIKGVGTRKVNDDLVVEANMANDIFETEHFEDLEDTIVRDENANHERIKQEMREVIEMNGGTMNRDRTRDYGAMGNYGMARGSEPTGGFESTGSFGATGGFDPTGGFEPTGAGNYERNVDSNTERQDYGGRYNESEAMGEREGLHSGEESMPEKTGQMAPKPSIIELANNPDFTIATISKEANRIKERDEGEVFVSLH